MEDLEPDSDDENWTSKPEKNKWSKSPPPNPEQVEPDDVQVGPEEQPQVQPEIIASVPSLKCPRPQCPFETLSDIYLKQHLEAARECQFCDKIYHGRHSNSRYQTHLKSHQKPVPTCDVCNKQFKFQSYVKKHKLQGPCGRK